jgi:hypothetical protein
MSRCLHGIFLPRNPKFKAADVCSLCKEQGNENTSYLSSSLTSQIMNDEWEEISDDNLYLIMNDGEFDHTVKDLAEEEISRRNTNNESE